MAQFEALCEVLGGEGGCLISHVFKSVVILTVRPD